MNRERRESRISGKMDRCHVAAHPKGQAENLAKNPARRDAFVAGSDAGGLDYPASLAGTISRDDATRVLWPRYAYPGRSGE